MGKRQMSYDLKELERLRTESVRCGLESSPEFFKWNVALHAASESILRDLKRLAALEKSLVVQVQTFPQDADVVANIRERAAETMKG